ncbi:MAG: divergent polysaccharide deacetylase family protein [Rhodopila sp.]|nr:divergent polysaccharide deacetylase family protein [Rhodopila sp.]
MAAQTPKPWQPSGMLAGWRGLVRFWVAVLAALGIGVGILETLGPPMRPEIAAPVPLVRSDPRPALIPAPPDLKGRTAARIPFPRERPGRDTPGPTTDPDPGLLEPDPVAPNLKLPRIGVEGRTPMGAYAAGFDPTSQRPRVGILIAGIGMSEADSLAAIKNLPGGVTLAISPYATNTDRLLAAARMTEHEYLLSIPMEPREYPANDPDDHHALMTSLSPAENLKRLRWTLSRVAGYVGITSALGPMRGERLAGVSDQFDAVLDEVAHRGLLFVDARTGQPPLHRAWNRSADVMIDDDPIDAEALDQRLDALTRIARDKGTALGIVSIPRPVTLERIAAWTNTLAAKGLALAPVSALVLPPATQEQEK